MEINKLSNATQKSMKTRIITGLILAAIAIPGVILGDWFFLVFVLLLVGVGLWEVLRGTGKKYPWPVFVLMYIFTFSFVFWTFFQKANPVQESVANYNPETGHFLMYDIRISTMGVGFLFASLFFVSIWSEKVNINDVFYLFGMSLFLGFSSQAILFLRFCPTALASEGFAYPNYLSNCLLLFYVLAGALLNDICAYFVGILFGKHKMNPRVSPKKTWEGFFGGVILSSAITVGFALICDGAFNTPLLDGVLDTERWYFIVLVSLSMSLASVLGDLMFSLIKRHYGIKDFGSIFPGHGGVLDRFDSVLMTAMLASIVIAFVYYQPLMGAIA